MSKIYSLQNLTTDPHPSCCTASFCYTRRSLLAARLRQHTAADPSRPAPVTASTTIEGSAHTAKFNDQRVPLRLATARPTRDRDPHLYTSSAKQLEWSCTNCQASKHGRDKSWRDEQGNLTAQIKTNHLAIYPRPLTSSKICHLSTENPRCRNHGERSTYSCSPD